MAHQHAKRPGRTGGGDGHREGVRAAKRVPAGGDRPAARIVPVRRPACGPDGEPAGGLDDGGGAHPRRPGTRLPALDLEALDTLIVQQWTKTLRGPYDWGDWPLARYTLGAGVLDAAQRDASAAVKCTKSTVVHLAWVCAMVACGRASRLRSLDPRPLPGPGAQQLVRADGARGWHCNLQRTAAGAQLRYWVHPSGSIEFETVCDGGD
jgi:hypothetical protein